MKRILVCGALSLLMAAAAAETFAQTPQPEDRRAPGRPGGPGGPGPGGNRPGPGQPGGPQIQPPRPGVGPVRPQPPRPNPPPRPRPPGANRPGRYPLGGYRRPPGYFFRQWAIGATLPGFFRAQSYWLSSPSRYGLRPAPRGTRWVRVDDDALLVSNRTGRVIEVRRNLFY